MISICNYATGYYSRVMERFIYYGSNLYIAFYAVGFVYGFGFHEPYYIFLISLRFVLIDQKLPFSAMKSFFLQFVHMVFHRLSKYCKFHKYVVSYSETPLLYPPYVA